MNNEIQTTPNVSIRQHELEINYLASKDLITQGTL